MLLIMTSGGATLTSCNLPSSAYPVVEKPVQSYITSQKFYKAEASLKNLNYKTKRSTVGESVTPFTTIDLSDMPDSVCFPLEEWVKMKATLLRGHDAYMDYKK